MFSIFKTRQRSLALEIKKMKECQCGAGEPNSVERKLKKQEVGHDTVSVSEQSRHVLVYGTGLRNKAIVTFLSFVESKKKNV